MGYKVNHKVFKLKFEDDEYEGLEVRAKSTSVGKFMRLVNIVEKDEATSEDVQELFEGFAKVLVSWNVEDDDDNPVPTTTEGLYSLDMDFVLPILRAWAGAIASVSPPLPPSSNNGRSSAEASLPMATL